MIIYKYNIVVGDLISMYLDKGAKVVRFGKQKDTLCLWIKLDEQVDRKECYLRYFTIVGTGQAFNEELTYIDSCEDGEFIWHLFEK